MAVFGFSNSSRRGIQPRKNEIIVTLQCVSAVSPDCGTKIQRKTWLNTVKTPKRAQNASKSHRRAVILQREVDVVVSRCGILREKGMEKEGVSKINYLIHSFYI